MEPRGKTQERAIGTGQHPHATEKEKVKEKVKAKAKTVKKEAKVIIGRQRAEVENLLKAKGRVRSLIQETGQNVGLASSAPPFSVEVHATFGMIKKS